MEPGTMGPVVHNHPKAGDAPPQVTRIIHSITSSTRLA